MNGLVLLGKPEEPGRVAVLAGVWTGSSPEHPAPRGTAEGNLGGAGGDVPLCISCWDPQIAPHCSKVQLECVLATDLAELREFLSWAVAWDFEAL